MVYIIYFHFAWLDIPGRSKHPPCRGFKVTSNQIHHSGKDSSARHRVFYLATHNSHTIQKSMHVVGFEPAMPTSE
jgi:hypothetical protein